MTPLRAFRREWERAIDDDRPLRLTTAQARLLFDTPLYSVLNDMIAKEIESQCPASSPIITEPSSALSGYGTAPTATIGAFAGMMTELDRESVARAANRRASAAVGQIVRRKRQRTR